jgi:hypothetical protein
MQGRILKIKTGYNPNSSSVGVDTVAFLTGGAAVTVLFNLVAAILAAARMQKAEPVGPSGEVAPAGLAENRR